MHFLIFLIRLGTSLFLFGPGPWGPGLMVQGPWGPWGPYLFNIFFVYIYIYILPIELPIVLPIGLPIDCGVG